MAWDDLTWTEQHTAVTLYQRHGPVADGADIDLDPQGYGALPHLDAKGVYAAVEEETAAYVEELEAGVEDVRPMPRVLFQDDVAPATLNAAREADLVHVWRNRMALTCAGERVAEAYRDGFEEGYALTPRGRALFADAPLVYRHPQLHETYQELVEGDTEPRGVVTISSGGAVGTSSQAEALADHLGVDHVNTGKKQRDLAEEYGYDDAETYREEVEDADLKVDVAKLERLFSGEPVVAEGRLDAALAAADAGDGTPIADVRIKLTCDDDTRARRHIASEDDYDIAEPGAVPEDMVPVAREAVRARDDSIYGAFADVYAGIDPRDDVYYTHVLDNAGGFDDTQERLRALATAALEDT